MGHPVFGMSGTTSQFGQSSKYSNVTFVAPT